MSTPEFPFKQIATDLIENEGRDPWSLSVWEAVTDWECDNDVFSSDTVTHLRAEAVRALIKSAVIHITFPETN